MKRRRRAARTRRERPTRSSAGQCGSVASCTRGSRLCVRPQQNCFNICVHRSYYFDDLFRRKNVFQVFRILTKRYSEPYLFFKGRIRRGSVTTPRPDISYIGFSLIPSFIGCVRGPSVQYRLPYTTDIAISWTQTSTTSTCARTVRTPSPYPTWSRY